MHFYNRKMKKEGAWAYLDGTETINTPPLFWNASKIELGDVFIYRTPDKCYLWLRVMGKAGPCWQPVDVGYERKDERILTVTEKRREVSWVHSPEWASKRVSACEYTASHSGIVHTANVQIETVKRNI